jgi:hypothetical protein
MCGYRGAAQCAVADARKKAGSEEPAKKDSRLKTVPPEIGLLAVQYPTIPRGPARFQSG